MAEGQRYLRPMARPNREIVLEAYALFNSGVQEPQLDYWHEVGEYHVAREDPDSTIHRGIDAVRGHFASWVEAYPDLRVEPLEVRENGDAVFVWVRFSGQGGGSGVPIEMELAHVLEMRDGRILRLVEFSDRTEGLEATGLGE